MAEEKKEKFIVRSVRAPEEVFDLLKELGDSEFASQGDALQYLVNLWNLESAKRSAGREKEIQDFQHFLGRIGELYVHSLSLCTDTEDRIRKEFADRLENQETTIRELREEREKIKVSLDAARQIVKEKDAAISKAEQERDSAMSELDRIRSEHDSLQMAIDNANVSIDEKRRRIRVLEEESSATEDLRQALADERKNSMELASKLNQAKLDGENNLRAAVLEEKEKRQEAYDKLNEKYDKLREEMDQLRNGKSTENFGKFDFTTYQDKQ